jgi:hypothetical protein
MEFWLSKKTIADKAPRVKREIAQIVAFSLIHV